VHKEREEGREGGREEGRILRSCGKRIFFLLKSERGMERDGLSKLSHLFFKATLDGNLKE
jgi:hypothetical protein